MIVMKIIKLFDMRKKYNSLKLEYEVLRESVETGLFESYLAHLNSPIEMDRLRKENKKLRMQVKSLKEIIKEK